MVTRMVGAEGGTSGSAAGVVEAETGGATGAGVAGAIVGAVIGEGIAAAEEEIAVPGAGGLSRMRSVTRSMRSVF